MQRIVPFRVFESQVTLTKRQETLLNNSTRNRGSWSLNPVGEVDVEGNFDCSEKKLVDFKRIKFGRVSGIFDCTSNNLTSLEGAPREVGGDFNCSDNELTSLEGAPEKVVGTFYCSRNKITSLEGSPQKVGMNFICISNSQTSLKGAPQEVGGNFVCLYNSLTSLEGAPQEVGGSFNCIGNKLISLVGAPREVGGDFLCRDNKLTSLVGAPREVGGDFWCHSNKLTSLVGAPREVKGFFETDLFIIPAGQWGLKGWLDAYVTGNEKARSLLLTLIGPDVINQMMQEAPEQTLIDLGPVWNDPAFAEIRAQIRIPDRYRDEMGLLGDLGELGF